MVKHTPSEDLYGVVPNAKGEPRIIKRKADRLTPEDMVRSFCSIPTDVPLYRDESGSWVYERSYPTRWVGLESVYGKAVTAQLIADGTANAPVVEPKKRKGRKAA
jgi:hypothetical protein